MLPMLMLVVVFTLPVPLICTDDVVVVVVVVVVAAPVGDA